MISPHRPFAGTIFHQCYKIRLPLNNRLVKMEICRSVSALSSEKGFVTSKMKGARADKTMAGVGLSHLKRQISGVEVSLDF